LRTILEEQEREGLARLRQDDVRLSRAETTHYAEMAYVGQIHTLRVPVSLGWGPAEVNQAFQSVYRREYGNTLGDIATQVISVRSVVTGLREHVDEKLPPPAPRALAAPMATRKVHFGTWHETPIYFRETLAPGMALTGPAIVEQADTTTVIEPGMHARVDAYGNLLVEVV